MTDWLIAAVQAGVIQAVAEKVPAMDGPPSTWGIVLINLIVVIPATLGAIGALIVSWRSSTKLKDVETKTDTVASATIEVAKVAEKINQAATEAKFAAFEANITAKQGVLSTTQVMTSAAEDVRAHAVVVQEIKDHVEVHSNGLRDLIAKISTVSDDIRRTSAVSGEIQAAVVASTKELSTFAQDVKRMADAVTEIKDAISEGTEDVKRKVADKRKT